MFKVRVDGLQFFEALKRKGGRLIEVLLVKSTALAYQLQSFIVSEKLSGQVLHRRTGVLSASVNAIPASLNAQELKIQFGVESSAGPAFYGHVFEEGGSRAYELLAVKARALAFVTNGQKVFAKSVMMPPQKQRAFMRPSVEEKLGYIRDELNAAVHETLTE